MEGRAVAAATINEPHARRIRSDQTQTLEPHLMPSISFRKFDRLGARDSARRSTGSRTRDAGSGRTR
jgi:hypothetical protein